MGSWAGKAYTKALTARFAMELIREARRRQARPKVGTVFRRIPPPGPAFPRRKGWLARKRRQQREAARG